MVFAILFCFVLFFFFENTTPSLKNILMKKYSARRRRLASVFQIKVSDLQPTSTRTYFFSSVRRSREKIQFGVRSYEPKSAGKFAPKSKPTYNFNISVRSESRRLRSGCQNTKKKNVRIGSSKYRGTPILKKILI